MINNNMQNYSEFKFINEFDSALKEKNNDSLTSSQKINTLNLLSKNNNQVQDSFLTNQSNSDDIGSDDIGTKKRKIFYTIENEKNKRKNNKINTLDPEEMERIRKKNKNLSSQKSRSRKNALLENSLQEKEVFFKQLSQIKTIVHDHFQDTKENERSVNSNKENENPVNNNDDIFSSIPNRVEKIIEENKQLKNEMKELKNQIYTQALTENLMLKNSLEIQQNINNITNTLQLQKCTIQQLELENQQLKFVNQQFLQQKNNKTND